MDEVVSCRSEANVGQVAEHEEVGSEEEEGEERPAVVEMLVGDDGEGEDDGFFGAEKDGGSGEHDLVIRDWVGTALRLIKKLQCKREATACCAHGAICHRG